ncbi:MAG: HD domain-containing phosphohydrolase, partial [Candidatus Acidiferrum sp.]
GTGTGPEFGAVRTVFFNPRVPPTPASAILFPCAESPASAAVGMISAKAMARPLKAKSRKPAAAARLTHELEELHRVGIALSETRDMDQLLTLILQKAREITHADAGSLYLIEHEAGSSNGSSEARRLRFRLTQNDSAQFPFSEHTIPLTEASMAGYCALHGEIIELADAYRIPKTRSFQFNSSFDEHAGYRTRSLVTLPMKNGKGEVLGVLQLINCKRNPNAKLTSAAAVRRYVQAFPESSVRLGLSLASQAAVAYENSRLYRDIENLFDGFVNASVKAIEQRDPTTSGHSQRVCDMTVALATAVDREPRGPYGHVRFSREQMKELRYAALLHDFGKVGVREEVLVKAKKLYPLQFSRLFDRFDYIRRDVEARTAQQKVEALLSLPRKEAEARLRALDEEVRRTLAELERYSEFIAKANEPTVLPASDFDVLQDIAEKTYRDSRGTQRPYLTSEEVRFLSIPRGSLDPAERQQIESHVVNSFNFLTQIPWTREFRGIPEIARAHHEKLNGKGYPKGLMAAEIPVQAKMMTICDIYDALSASDRPYKRAVPTDRAIDILKLCVRDEEIDSELFRVFLDAHVYCLVSKSA